MPGGNDEGHPARDGRMDEGCPGRGAGLAAMLFPRAAVPALQAQGPLCRATPPASEDALPGSARDRPGPAWSREVGFIFWGWGGCRGGSRSPAGVGVFGPGKAAAEIYDAGGQSVKAVYHHQVGLKERKHIFNKKRGFAIQLRC